MYIIPLYPGQSVYCHFVFWVVSFFKNQLDMMTGCFIHQLKDSMVCVTRHCLKLSTSYGLHYICLTALLTRYLSNYNFS